MTRTIFVLGATILLGAVAGCSEEPGSTVSAGFVMSPAVPQSTGASGWLDSKGGGLSTGSVQLSVPPGSLNHGLAVTLESGEDGGRVWCAVSPCGQPLVVPGEVTLPLPSNARPGAKYRILGLDPVSGEWVDLGGSVELGRISARIGHFSRFEVDIAD